MSKYLARWEDGYVVEWRNLTWKEYNSFKIRYRSSPFKTPMDVAMDIYKICRINGPVPAAVPAGIVAFICKQQMENNPFGGNVKDVASALRQARLAVENDYFLAATGLIANTLNYKIDEIVDWDPQTFFLRLAQSEIVTGHKLNVAQPEAQDKPQIRKKELSPRAEIARQRVRDRDRG